MPDVQSTPVRSSIVVDATVDHAFAVFTDDMAGWWPPEHHILQPELASMEFEPRVGGSIIDRGVDGSECLGPGSSPTTLHTGSSSVGTSASRGRWSPIPSGRARSR